MAGNRVPLIVPCHRVVRASGDIGPYSAAEGTTTKRRLLEMEAANSQK
jgi:methylated-DNA-[protein]-cysteine S-methyltransferase